MNTFIFTCGDPNGIGPEIVIKSLNKVYSPSHRYYIICPKNIFLKNASLIKPNFEYSFSKEISYNTYRSKSVEIIDIKGGKLSVGKPTKISGKISFNSLELACEIAEKYGNSAIITAPISKEAWRLNSLRYEGHTDYLGQRYKVKNPLMLFYSRKMIAALVTIHQPIERVSKLLTQSKIKSILNDVLLSLKRDFVITNPKVAVLGLNPHAGENGTIGNEEITKIKPVLEKFNDAYGPFVPDAFFGKKLFKNYDAVIGMYHDQVLIPFKMLNFDRGVNFTANLPIVRTSPDHGTAFDIAYKGTANPSSMIEAVKLANTVIRNRILS